MKSKALLGLVMAFILSGCSTTKTVQTSSHLGIRVSSLENQLDVQDQSISDLQSSVEELAVTVKHLAAVKQQTSQVSTAVKKTSTPKTTAQNKYDNILRVPVAPTKVQEALKTAGYYTGSIDGKLGPNSEKAIKEFQTDHDLASDGIIGRKTWAELKLYLE